VDVGGLALALGTSSLGEDGMGKGWGGWEDSESAGAPCVVLNQCFSKLSVFLIS